MNLQQKIEQLINSGTITVERTKLEDYSRKLDEISNISVRAKAGKSVLEKRLHEALISEEDNNLQELISKKESLEKKLEIASIPYEQEMKKITDRHKAELKSLELERDETNRIEREYNERFLSLENEYNLKIKQMEFEREGHKTSILFQKHKDEKLSALYDSIKAKEIKISVLSKEMRMTEDNSQIAFYKKEINNLNEEIKDYAVSHLPKECAWSKLNQKYQDLIQIESELIRSRRAIEEEIEKEINTIQSKSLKNGNVISSKDGEEIIKELKSNEPVKNLKTLSI